MIGVLNRTIERAPTNPKDKAKEDLTIEITNTVVRRIYENILLNSSLLVKVIQIFCSNLSTIIITSTIRFTTIDTIEIGGIC